MLLTFRARAEAQPGPVWGGLFREYWPNYRKWWAGSGAAARPTWLEGLDAMRTHMPEIVPLYEELVEVAGGKDDQARFLSYYCPPPYLSGCSQAIWPGGRPVLVRNYDYSPYAFDGTILRTEWQGRTVMGMTDGLFGLVDGINDAGLALSLTFGGRQVVGDGFGVPLILRYVLQTCNTADEAGAALARIPTHMSYNVTAMDAKQNYVTVHMAPDRPAIVTHAAVATNHQEKVEWASHARFTATVERERFLLQRLTLHVESANRFVSAFLRPPLYSVAFNQGFGTLYTAVYEGRQRRLTLHWPGKTWKLEMRNFQEGNASVRLPDAALPGATRST